MKQSTNQTAKPKAKSDNGKRVPTHQPKTPTPESLEDKVRALEQECENLRRDNHLLQTRVLQDKESGTLESRRYDQLLKELRKLQEQNATMLACLTTQTPAGTPAASA
jgi:hypothetical protein